MLPQEINAALLIAGLTLLRFGVPMLAILALGATARRVQTLTP